MLGGILRIGFLAFAVFGIITGGYEIFQGKSIGLYDLGGGLIWGLGFLVITAWQNKKAEKQGVYYEQQRN